MLKNLVMNASWAAGFVAGRTQRTRDAAVAEVRAAYHDGWCAGMEATEPPRSCFDCGSTTDTAPSDPGGHGTLAIRCHPCHERRVSAHECDEFCYEAELAMKGEL